MKRLDALAIAQALVDDLKPACERIHVAGSLRRGAEEVKDIELLVIPGPGIVTREQDLFGDVISETHKCSLDTRLEFLMAGFWPWRKDDANPKWGKKYKRLRYKTGICCDLFITDRRRWGYQLAIRTGPARFSKALVTLAMRRRYHCTDSLLHQHPRIDEKNCPKGDTCPLIIPTFEEAEFLYALQLPWIEPSDRTEDWAWDKAKEKVFDDIP